MSQIRISYSRLFRPLFPLALFLLLLLGTRLALAAVAPAPLQPAAEAPRATLSAGDLAIIGMNSDTPDAFAFVLLTNVDAGTAISFTDNGWLAAGGFRDTEGTATWTAPTTLCAGTVLTPDLGTMALSSSGDQILAYQGAATSPTMLYGLNNEGAAVWQTDATSANTSALPDGLTNGTTAVAVTETDNVIYTGPVSGTVAALQAAIGNPANWTGDDDALQIMPSGPFTVTDAAPCSGPGQVLINEVDADTPGTDAAEFAELYDGGSGSTSLDGLVVVFFNGNGDTVYESFDLDGFTTNSDGYFFLGNSALSPDIAFADNTLQNGADAVALYQADAADFPAGTPVTTTSLVDALVYDTDDGDDPGLLILLNPGEPQVNERDGGSGTEDSNQRCPNGLGGLRNTSTYTQDAPTPGAANVCGGSGGTILVCGAPAALIHEVQGSGAATPLLGATVEIEGVVVGDFQDTGDELSGFYLQEEDGDADADPASSEGVFVYDNGFGVDVNVGEVVRVAGTADEFFDLTQIDTVTGVTVCSSGNAVSPATVTLPVSSVDDLEAFEGMSIAITQTLYATDNFNTGRYGEVALSVDGRLFQGTHLFEPGAAALAHADLNRRSQIQLDDGSTVQNPLPLPPYLGPDNTLRAGDTTAGLNGVLSYSFGAYEVHPTQVISFTRVNDRSAAPPDVGGTIQVATFNVLNFFTTIDTGQPICGPAGDLDCRGADTVDEFNRQRDKIIDALVQLDADVIAISEVENNQTAAMQSLVDGLNAAVGAGTYAFVDTGFIGTDAIKVGFLYDTTTIGLVGDYAILDASVDPIFLDEKNRPALAQTFEELATGERFTAVANHLKSKGSSCDDVGDPDQGDGQGNCSGTRTDAATALVNWLQTDPTGSGDPDFIILGDLNSYAKEDPIDVLAAGGYVDLLASFFGSDAYSYVFFGEAGYLDYIMPNAGLTAQVSGVAVWHINADEPSALDYNNYNQPLLYNPDPYRASDHDPLVVGLDLAPSYRLWLPLVVSGAD